MERATHDQARPARLRAGKSDNIGDARPEIAQAYCHFVDLRVDDERDRQVGVDPHIERNLLLAYLGGAHGIVLVTRDTDYMKVAEAVAQHAGRAKVEIVSLDPADSGRGGLRRYEATAAGRWAWAKGDPAPASCV